MNEKNNKRTIFGWTMYDWGKSAYETAILGAIMPVYFISAVIPETPIDVFTKVLAATAPATPSNIIIRPAKYTAASPKYFGSLKIFLSNFKQLTTICKNCPNIIFYLFSEQDKTQLMEILLKRL